MRSDKLLILFLVLVLTNSFVMAEVGYGESNFGVHFESPKAPINYSLIPTVNSSSYWDDLDSPADLLLSMFDGPNWIDENMDFNGENITNVNWGNFDNLNITNNGYIYGDIFFPGDLWLGDYFSGPCGDGMAIQDIDEWGSFTCTNVGNASFNQSFIDTIYLNLSGTNANQNINISPYTLLAGGIILDDHTCLDFGDRSTSICESGTDDIDIKSGGRIDIWTDTEVSFRVDGDVNDYFHIETNDNVPTLRSYLSNMRLLADEGLITITGNLDATGYNLTGDWITSNTFNGSYIGDGSQLTGLLKLDQTTPQTIINGVPLLDETPNGGVDIKSFVNKEYVDLAVTSLGAAYYMYDEDDATGYKTCYLNPSGDAETYIEVADLNDDDYIGGWISAPNEAPPKLLKGVYDWLITAEKTTGIETLRVYWELVERKSDTSEVVIATSSNSNELDGKSTYLIPLQLTEDYIPDSGSRIVGKLYADVSGSGNAPTIRIYYQGETSSRWEIPANSEIFQNIFVPYTGAVSNVDLGEKNLTLNYLQGVTLNFTKAYLGDLIIDADNITVNNILNKSEDRVKIWSDLEVTRNVGIGTSANTENALTIEKTSTEAIFRGLGMTLDFQPAGVGSSMYGLSFGAKASTVANNIQNLYGLQGIAGTNINSGYTGKITNLAGLQSSISLPGNTAGDDPTATNGYLFFGQDIATTFNSPTPFTNLYGLYLPSITAGSALNYGIYTQAGLNHFGDDVEIIGDLNVTKNLEVKNITANTLNVTKAHSHFGPAPLSPPHDDDKDMLISTKKTSIATSNAPVRSGLFVTEFNGTTNSDSIYMGLNAFGFTTASSTADLTNTNVAGMVGGRYGVRPAGSGTISKSAGVSSQFFFPTGSSATITDGRTFWAEGPLIQAGSELTTSYGLYVSDASNSGTLTNQYGIYIEDLDAGTNNYGLFIKTQNNVIEGDVNITGNLTVGSGISVNEFIEDFDGDEFAQYEFLGNNFNGSGNFTGNHGNFDTVNTTILEFEKGDFNSTLNDVYWNTSLADDVATYNLYLGGVDGTETEASIYEFEGDVNITGNSTIYGDAEIESRLNVGSKATLTAGQIVHVGETMTTPNVAATGLQFNIELKPTDTMVSDANGIIGTVAFTNNEDMTATAIGANVGVFKSGTGTMAKAVGAQSTIMIVGGDITEADMFLAETPLYLTGTIDIGYGFRHKGWDSENVGTKYAFYADADDSYLGGELNVTGNIESDTLRGSYSNGEAYVCVYDNGTIFAKDSACS